MPQTKQYLDCLNKEVEAGRKKLHDGELYGTPSEVGNNYLSIVNRCEAIEMIANPETIFNNYNLMIEDEE